MKLANKSLVFLTVLFFFSCGSKKSTIEYREVIKNDTIIKTKVETLIERFTDTLTIENPCTEKGDLKPFNQVIKTNQGNISLVGKNNVITANIDLKAYQKIWETEYKSKLDKSTLIKEKEVIRYKIPLWIIILCPLIFGIGFLIGRFT